MDVGYKNVEQNGDCLIAAALSAVGKKNSLESIVDLRYRISLKITESMLFEQLLMMTDDALGAAVGSVESMFYDKLRLLTESKPSALTQYKIQYLLCGPNLGKVNNFEKNISSS